MSETNAGDTKLGGQHILKLVSRVAVAYLSHNPVPTAEVAGIIRAIAQALTSAGRSNTLAPAQKPVPAVPLKRSVTADYLICLEDGLRMKMLKRHLRVVHGLSPEGYRTKWGLPRDYPMAAPKYAEERSRFAKAAGLGRRKTRRAPTAPAGKDGPRRPRTT